jgi:hypothetical protein
MYSGRKESSDRENNRVIQRRADAGESGAFFGEIYDY